MTQVNNNDIEKVITLSKKILSKKKIGTAYEQHDLRPIWELGEAISSLCRDRNLLTILTDIEKRCKLEKLRFDDLLYKHSKTIYDFWSEDQFLDVIKQIDKWRKLRVIVPLLKFVLQPSPKLTREQIEHTIDECEGKSFEEVYEIVKKLRRKCDPIFKQFDIDLYEVDDNLREVNQELYRLIEQRDQYFENIFRNVFNESLLRSIRIYLSALQKEDLFKTFKPDLERFSKTTLPEKIEEVNIKKIIKVIEELKVLIKSYDGREMFRQEFGIAQLGYLSTYMKAFSSDDNLKKFKEDEIVLKRLTQFLGEKESTG
jgi:hypothetical protein